MRILIVLAALVLSSPAVQACSCAYNLLSDKTVRAAKSIFIFQLVSARILAGGDGPSSSHDVEARIRVVEQLRGQAEVTSFRYSTFWCCGSRFEVGHYYAAFLEKPADSFFGHAGNLMHVGEEYSAGTFVSSKLRDVAATEQTIEEAFGEFPSDSVMSIPPPPPPCPPVQSKESL